MKKWETFNSKIILDTSWIRIRQDKVKLPNGKNINDYYVVEEDNAAIIFALNKDGKIIFVKQYKHAVGQIMLELPGGYFNSKEKPEKAARREFLEETGYRAKDFKLIGKINNNPTRLTSINFIFLARNAEKVTKQNTDEAEQIEVILLTPKEALEKVRRGKIWASTTVTGLLLGCQTLGLL